MPSQVTFRDVQSYLDAIADNPVDNGDIDSSNHQRFWNSPYKTFLTMTVPGENCNGQPIPVVGALDANGNANLAQCPFYQALVGPTGWCNKGQMPRTGPPQAFITDPGCSVQVTKADGTKATMTGQQIRSNIEWWLTHGLPET